MSMSGDRVLARLQLYRNDAVASTRDVLERAPIVMIGRSPECDVRCMLPTFGLHHVKLDFDKTSDKVCPTAVATIKGFFTPLLTPNRQCLVTCLDPVNGAYLNNNKLDVGVEYDMKASDVLIVNDRKFGIVFQEQLRPAAVDTRRGVEQNPHEMSPFVKQSDVDATHGNASELLKCVLGKSWDTQDQLPCAPPAELDEVPHAQQLEQLPQNHTTHFQVPENLHLPASAEAVLEQHSLVSAPQLADQNGVLVQMSTEANATVLVQTASEPATSAEVTNEPQPQLQSQFSDTIIPTQKTVNAAGDMGAYGAEPHSTSGSPEPRDLDPHNPNSEYESSGPGRIPKANLLHSDTVDTVKSHSKGEFIGESLESNSAHQQEPLPTTEPPLSLLAQGPEIPSVLAATPCVVNYESSRQQTTEQMASTLTNATPKLEVTDLNLHDDSRSPASEPNKADMPACEPSSLVHMRDGDIVTSCISADHPETEATVVHVALAADGPALPASAESFNIPIISTTSENVLPRDIYDNTGGSGLDYLGEVPSIAGSGDDVANLGLATPATEMTETRDEKAAQQAMEAQDSAPQLYAQTQTNPACDDPAHAPETMARPEKSPCKTSSNSESNEQNAFTSASSNIGKPTFADNDLDTDPFIDGTGPISVPKVRENPGLGDRDKLIKDDGESAVELPSDLVSVDASAQDIQSASGLRSPAPKSPVIEIARTPDAKAAKSNSTKRTPRSCRAADVPETPASSRRRSVRQSVASAAMKSMSPAISRDVDKMDINEVPTIPVTASVFATTKSIDFEPQTVDSIAFKHINEVPTIPLLGSVFATTTTIDVEPRAVEVAASKEISIIPLQPPQSSSKSRGDSAGSDENAISLTNQMDLSYSGADSVALVKRGTEFSSAIVQDAALTPGAMCPAVDAAAAQLESSVHPSSSPESSESAVQMLADKITPALQDMQATDLGQPQYAIPDRNDKPQEVDAAAPVSEVLVDDGQCDARDEKMTAEAERMIVEDKPELPSIIENLDAEKVDSSAGAASNTTAPNTSVSQPVAEAPSTRSLRSRDTTNKSKATSLQPVAAADDKDGDSSDGVAIELTPRLTRTQKAAAEAKVIKTHKKKVTHSQAKTAKKTVKGTASVPVPKPAAEVEVSQAPLPQQRPPKSLQEGSEAAKSVDHPTATAAPLSSPADVSPSGVAGRKRTRATTVSEKPASPSHKPNSIDADAKVASDPEAEPEQPAKRMTRRRLAAASAAANDDTSIAKDEGNNSTAASQEEVTVSETTSIKRVITETKDDNDKAAKILPQKRTRSAAAAAPKEDDYGRAQKRAASRRGKPVPIFEPAEASAEAEKDEAFESEKVVEAAPADPPKRRGRATRAAAADANATSTEAAPSTVAEKTPSPEPSQIEPEQKPIPVRKGRSAGPAKAEPSEPRTTRKRAEAAAAVSDSADHAFRGSRSQKHGENGPVADKPAPKRRGQAAKTQPASSHEESEEDKADAAPALHLRGGRTVRRAVVAKADLPAKAPKDKEAPPKTRQTARAKKAATAVTDDEQENVSQQPRRATRSTAVVNAKAEADDTSESGGSEGVDAINEEAASVPDSAPIHADNEEAESKVEDLPPVRRTRARATAPAEPAAAKAPVRKTRAAAAAVKAPAVRTTRARAARNAAAPAAE
ncbi:hypothetical protein HDU88_003406 [Geranomyces variabilis]|nr:hypothetical protein HDU88_003406 [Geranomyces variabilis]